MGYKKIDNYGIIGNGQTLALVGIDGSIDWMCLPYMDSPSVFAAVLDDEKGGCFSVQACDPWDSVQSYIPRTNILKTSFRTFSGEFDLTDFMPIGHLAEKDPSAMTMVNRRLRGTKGRVKVEVVFSPRFQYGLKTPEWQNISDGVWRLTSENEAINLFISSSCEKNGESFVLDLDEGETVWFSAAYGEIAPPPSVSNLEEFLEETEQYWLRWVRVQETGKYPHLGFWQDDLDRAALVLKLLQFKDTGAIAAAASCSLPTIIYGERNWDYRFSWVRDTSMTLQALFELGHTKEVSLYMEWLKKLGRKGGEVELEVLYKLREPVAPAGEKPLDHLNGYKGSRPVLTGQFNVGQHQHDIYGELLDMIFSMSRLVGKIDPEYWGFIRKVVEKVISIWRDKDNGIWELRTGPYHVTHSKVMSWVALDRGIKIAEHYGFQADLGTWRAERDAVHKDVLEKAYNPKRGSFTQHYDTEEVDAALLQIPLVGFLPADDPRMVSTIETIEEELMVGGIPLRYKTDDGLPGQEHGWLICLFWYLRCLIRQKRFDEVEARLRDVSRYANHLGLLGEEYDTIYKEITGNFPQAFSHIGYAMTVLEYTEARQVKKIGKSATMGDKIGLFLHGRNLTPVFPREETEHVEDPGTEIKRIMNILRGQFYDGQRQRIDYALISESEHFKEFEKAVACLEHFDPATLTNDSARIAFWTNVFNTLVIHGVIALNIKESVKEFPLFFEKVRYLIGEHEYSLSDIEHGILRGNEVPPYRLRKRFSEKDPRLSFCISKPDPRVHFALVCASRTCPPIEAYSEDILDEQLETSGKVFINATTEISKENNILQVSEIFKWYRKDFALADSCLANYISKYLYDLEEADWVRDNSDSIVIHYTPYDWRLNR